MEKKKFLTPAGGFDHNLLDIQYIHQSIVVPK